MKILFVGDIVGRIGKKALKDHLKSLRRKYKIDFVIVNAENISGGRGISLVDYHFLSSLDIDSITLGNHYLDKREELLKILSCDEEKEKERIVLPLNSKSIYLEQKELDERSKLYEVNGVNIRVTSILGKMYSKEEVVEPFFSLNNLIELLEDENSIHIIDYHCEANGEKRAFALFFKDDIKALIGTHTHVQSSDSENIDSKVLYISDVGMTGSSEGVFGYTLSSIFDKQVLNKNVPLKLVDEGEYVLSCCILEYDSNLAPLSITPLKIKGSTLNEN